MRKLLLALLCCLPALAQFTPVGSAYAISSNANTATTSATSTVGATLIVLAVTSYQGSAGITPTDSTGSNTWTPLTEQSYTAYMRTRLWYCINPVTSASQTFSASLTGSYPSIAMYAFSSGTATPAFDQQNGAAFGDQVTANPGNVTPAYANELIITAVGHNNTANAWAINLGFSTPVGGMEIPAKGFGLYESYLIETSIVSQNPEWQTTVESYASTAVIATFNSVASTKALSITGCTTGSYGVASATCTVTISNATFDGVHSVTITDSDHTVKPGTFTYSSTPYVGAFTVTPANLATTFTFTYTPAVVGTRAFTTTNTFSAFIDATSTYTATSAQPCTFTMTGSGTQSIAATTGWTSTGGCGHSSPTTGDALVATASGGALTITVPNDGVTHSLGSCPAANTTYDLQLTAAAAGSAVFDVQPGAKFYFCGNKLLTAPVTAAGSTPTLWADLKYETGAMVYEDEAQASYAHRTISAATGEWSRFLWGASTDTCTFGPGTSYTCPTNVQAVNAGSVNPVLYDVASTTDAAIYKIYGTGLKTCGSAATGCLNYATDGNSSRNNYADADLIALGGDVFDTTGAVQSVGTGFDRTTQLQIVGNHFVNDLAGFAELNTNTATTSKSCTISGNYFATGVGNPNLALSPCAFTGNVFAHGLPIGGFGAFPLTAYSGNVIFWDNAIGDPYVDRVVTAPIVNNYLANITNAGSNHGFNTGTTNDYYRGNIFESPIPGSGEGHCSSSTATGTNTVIALDNLSLPAASGVNTCQLYGWTGTALGTQPVLWADHNGGYGAGAYSWLVWTGHTTAGYPGNQVLRSFRANIGWAPSVSGGNLGVNSDQGGGAISSAPNNNVYVAQETNNAWYNATSSSSFGSGVNTNCNPSTSQGTPYDQCTASGTPGLHDVTANPKLLDPTRGLFKWASVMQGQAASLAGAEAALLGCQNLPYCIAQLEWWVKAGYQPTNLALKGAAHDGGVVGVTGTPGSGYSGSCSAAVTVQDADDLGAGAVLTCSFVGGVPVVAVVNPGMHYRVATPATVTITGTGGSGTSLNALVSPSDIGPVPITSFAGVGL